MDERTEARIYCNRGPSIPVWDVYIPETGHVWRTYGRKVHVAPTQDMAYAWARDNGYQPVLGSA